MLHVRCLPCYINMVLLLIIYLFGFDIFFPTHSIGYITMDNFKGKENLNILVGQDSAHQLLCIGKQLPTFPHKV